ncbi:FtsK/SpoIIIE domain-containing protein [Homoserinimonas sp. OAct 916]|uniref:FtsK/SpoIIIE domain-containing protein n=1 Tax=Homoserinimonas sp. OAct 916 TaxID=2211450 RepID=UPI000DBE55CD|nr:FtsK/SpoIIIE domain-containing protein [Homoserinimonas sp. OAct 916]
MQHPFDDRAGTQQGEQLARTFAVPTRPPLGTAPGFPVIGAVAPVIGAVAIWLMTGSPFVLVFAALGPIVAVAGVVDQRRGRRRQRLRELAAHEAALVHLENCVPAEIGRRREILRVQNPGARELLSRDAGGDSRWRDVDARQLVALGFGSVPSGLRLEDPPGGAEDSRVAALRRAAAIIPNAPVVGDCAGGIAICGPPTIVRAIARGYLVQLLNRLPPESLHLRLPTTPEWDWARSLPHREGNLQAQFAPGSARTVFEVVDLFDGSRRATEKRSAVTPGTIGSEAEKIRSLMVVAPDVRRLPAQCATLVDVAGADHARIIVGAGPGERVSCELVSAAEAAEFAQVLRAHAHDRGVVSSGEMFSPVQLANLLDHRSPGSQVFGTGPSGPRSNLAAPVGRAAQETITLDLVADGPHALVGGTTGSGKSELLITWVTAMAASYSPESVTFLLVDFKGGAAFAPLAALPHCVGVITDLGRTEATRALASVGAEITYRESVLHRAGARDITELTGETLPRLVVVVDEFAAMLDDFPDLYELFVDIAARGRSLGLHLILCTQRPAGVVRDALRANCNLRLSLRVNNAPDSEAVIGTNAAVMLPAASPGACCLAASGGPVGFMVATTDTEMIMHARARFEAGPAPPRRPWLDPLPAVIGLEALPALVQAAAPNNGEPPVADVADEFVLGVTDLPEEQKQEVLRYRPAVDGNLLLLGAARTGKTSCLHLLAVQSRSTRQVRLVPRGIEGAWDTVTDLAQRAASGSRGAATLLLIDDLDSLVSRIPVEHSQDFLDAVHLLARDGSQVGIQLVATTRRATGLAAILSLFEQTIMLRMTSSQEHVLAGGAASQWDAALPPGGGIHRQHRVQLAVTDAVSGAPEPQPAVVEFVPGHGYLLVSAWPRRRARQLREFPGAAPRVVDIGHEVEQARAYADGDVSMNAHHDPTSGRGGELILQHRSATILVGDTDHWQSQPALFGRLRRSCTLVFDGCSVAEYRMLTRSRDVPPPLEVGASRVWLLAPGGEVGRARWPTD